MIGVPLGYGNYDGPVSERKLTYFTEEQLAVLHAFYARIREHYALRAYRLTKAEVARLARETGLTDQQVRKWYTRQQLIDFRRASWWKWEVGTTIVWLAIWAVGIVCMPKVVPRDEMLWAHTSTATVAALFLLTYSYACFIAGSWSRATMATICTEMKSRGGQRNNSPLSYFGLSWPDIRERHARQQQWVVLWFFLWTWANLAFWSVYELEATRSAGSRSGL